MMFRPFNKRKVCLYTLMQALSLMMPSVFCNNSIHAMLFKFLFRLSYEIEIVLSGCLNLSERRRPVPVSPARAAPSRDI